MRRLLLATCLAPASLALAAGEAPPARDALAGWTPREVTAEAKDKKEIQALFLALDTAAEKGDAEAAAALVDFPVLVATDDAKGEASAEAWTRERFLEIMRPRYEALRGAKVSHSVKLFLVTDSLASVDKVTTLALATRTTTFRSTALVVRRNGRWLFKSIVEGGWGDQRRDAEAARPAPTSAAADAPRTQPAAAEAPPQAPAPAATPAGAAPAAPAPAAPPASPPAPATPEAPPRSPEPARG